MRHPNESETLRRELGIGFVPEFTIPDDPQPRAFANFASFSLSNRQAAHIGIHFQEVDETVITPLVYWTEGIVFVNSPNDVRFYRIVAQKSPNWSNPKFFSGVREGEVWVKCDDHKGTWTFTGHLGSIVDKNEFLALNPKSMTVSQ